MPQSQSQSQSSQKLTKQTKQTKKLLLRFYTRKYEELQKSWKQQLLLDLDLDHDHDHYHQQQQQQQEAEEEDLLQQLVTKNQVDEKTTGHQSRSSRVEEHLSSSLLLLMKYTCLDKATPFRLANYIVFGLVWILKKMDRRRSMQKLQQ